MVMEHHAPITPVLVAREDMACKELEKQQEAAVCSTDMVRIARTAFVDPGSCRRPLGSKEGNPG